MSSLEHICKCVTCGKILKDDDEVFQLRTWNGTEDMYQPACSMLCAQKANQKNIDWIKGHLYDVVHQGIQRMTVHNYYGEWK